MAGDAVEVVLVALIPAAHGPIQPEARLDSAAADKMVPLAGEGFGGIGLGGMSGGEGIAGDI